MHSVALAPPPSLPPLVPWFRRRKPGEVKVRESRRSVRLTWIVPGHIGDDFTVFVRGRHVVVSARRRSAGDGVFYRVVPIDPRAEILGVSYGYERDRLTVVVRKAPPPGIWSVLLKRFRPRHRR